MNDKQKKMLLKLMEFHNHEWVVFSTCVGTCELMLQCATCNAIGVVSNPTKDEWRKGFYAPSEPYKWHEAERVQVVNQQPQVEFIMKNPEQQH